jgi:hypothetical protein
LELNKRLVDITKSNENVVNSAVGGVFASGMLLSIWGARRWHNVIQRRDDRLAELQLEKLEAEMARLRREDAATPTRS